MVQTLVVLSADWLLQYAHLKGARDVFFFFSYAALKGYIGEMQVCMEFKSQLFQHRRGLAIRLGKKYKGGLQL